MKVAEEFIRALYAIRDAIKGNSGESGEGGNSNDNGLFGADAVYVGNHGSINSIPGMVFRSMSELMTFFKSNVRDFTLGAYGQPIHFLYTDNTIDVFNKPRIGVIAETYQSTNAKEYRLKIDFASNLQDYTFTNVNEALSSEDVAIIAEELGNNTFVLEIN